MGSRYKCIGEENHKFARLATLLDVRPSGLYSIRNRNTASCLDTRSGVLCFNTLCFYLVIVLLMGGDRGSIVVKVLRYKSEGRWFDPSKCQWIFH